MGVWGGGGEETFETFLACVKVTGERVGVAFMLFYCQAWNVKN